MGPAWRDGRTLGPYSIVREIGRGGMGVVYEARDATRGATVALKALRRHISAAAGARLKREFRTLSDVRHPNLVAMYELHCVDDEWFFTMQRVQGVSLLGYIWDGPARPATLNLSRLTSAFAQLSTALLELHARGIVHLDLKPENVLVDAQGQLRVLDFGLARSLHLWDAKLGMAGTPAYMAPEQRRGEPATPAADWYALGVMLHEVLTGSRRLDREQELDAVQAPPQLVALCRQLLAESPQLRPGAQPVLQALGQEPGRPPRRHVFVGRERALGTLRAGLESSQGARWIHAHGESGVGKSALLKEFLDEVRARQAALVLTGRCHEREAVPYQGVDTVVDQLAAALASEAPPQLRARVAPAASIFASLHSWGPKEKPAGAPQDPRSVRRAAFAGLRQLLRAACDRGPVLIAIDDVHWGDRDGGRLLAELVTAHWPQGLLLVTTGRSADVAGTAMLGELSTEQRATGECAQPCLLPVEPLSDGDVRHMLAQLSPDVDAERRAAIVKEAAGLPFLASALAHTDHGEVSLDSFVRQQLLDHGPLARRGLQALALTSAPLPQAIAFGDAAKAGRLHEVITDLRHASLLRTDGDTPDGPVEMYHARLATAVRATLSPKEQASARLALATALNAAWPHASEQLADLYALGGDEQSAARHAERAADGAEAMLAFDRAVRWYDRAMVWEGSARLRPKVAQALENAGRCAEAAEAFERAADESPAHAQALLRSAAANWLNVGHVDRGLQVLRAELAELGIAAPKREARALLAATRLAARLWLRGRELAQPERVAAPLTRKADVCWMVAKGLTTTTPTRSLVFYLESLLAALDAGDALRTVRALSALGALQVSLGGPFAAGGERWMAQARAMAQALDDPYAKGVVAAFRALADSVRSDGHPKQVTNTAALALEQLGKVPTSTAWEDDVARGLILLSQDRMGEFEQLTRDTLRSRAEAAERGDRYAEVVAGTGAALGLMASGKTSEARRAVREPLQQWLQTAYTVQHYYGDRTCIMCAMYEGDGEEAYRILRRQWPRWQRAQLTVHAISRREILLLRGILESWRCTQGLSDHRDLRKWTVGSARRLEGAKAGVDRAHAHLLRACHARHRGEGQRATTHLRRAVGSYRAAGWGAYEACAQIRLHQQLHDEPDPGAVDWLSRRGVAEPHKFVEIYVP